MVEGEPVMLIKNSLSLSSPPNPLALLPSPFPAPPAAGLLSMVLFPSAIPARPPVGLMAMAGNRRGGGHRQPLPAVSWPMVGGRGGSSSLVKKKYTCNLCSYSTDYPTNIQRHMLTHTGERPFRCDTCNKGFTTKQNLESHKLQHTKNAPPPPSTSWGLMQ